MKTIAIDLSSGDKGFKEALDASIKFAILHKDWKLVCFSTTEENIDTKELPENIEIVKVKNKIFSTNSVMDSIRDTESTLYAAIDSVLNSKTNAVVSAASSSVLTSLGYMKFRAINSDIKVGFCPIFIDFNGRKKIALDAGANLSFDANVLETYALMGKAFAKTLNLSQDPKVGLLNIGSEENKGDQLRLDTFAKLLNNPKINFIGNVEADEYLSKDYDVLIADAFSGNIALKVTESIFRKVISILKQTKHSSKGKLALLLTKNTMVKEFKQFLNADSSGGAIVLGLNHIMIKAHGSSDSREFYNSIMIAKNSVENDLIKKIEEELKQHA